MLLKNLSYHKKIFTGMIIAALVPMVIGYLAMVQVFNITYENNLEEEAGNALNAIGTSIDTGFENIYEAIESLSHNQMVIEMLSDEENQNDYMAYRELYAVTTAYGHYAHFCIYDANGILKSSMADNDYIKKKLPLDWSVLYESTRKPSETVVRNARIYRGENKEEFLRVARAVCDYQGIVRGYIVAVVLNEHFDYMLKGTGLEKSGLLYAMDNFHEVVFRSSENSDTQEFQTARAALLSEDSRHEIRSDEFAYHHTYLEPHGLHIFYRQPIGTLKLLKNNIKTIAVITGVISVLICLLISGSFSNVFYKPIKRMQEAIAQIKEGNFNAKVKVYSNDELGQLSQSINVMAEHINDNMNRLILRERELSEANIKMMQAQLNPHFIYNTLDTLKWIGKANQLPEIAVLSSGLAQILRTSISAEQIVTLKQETELVEAYVEIQKIRFDDKFEFLTDIPEELMDAKVPKLILQPVIENAIIHGFSGRDYGMVLVQGKLDRESNQLRIFVRDDGVGVLPDVLERLNRHEAPEKMHKTEENGKNSSSIGFYNVNEIIRLNYGNAYGISIESVPGEGTTVQYVLPYYV